MIVQKLLTLLEKGEGENVEFKEYLTSYHLKEDRFRQLACQMNHRIIMGKGTAYYVIGVADSGSIRGISKEAFRETIEVLKKIASEIEAEISAVEEYEVGEGRVGIVEITKKVPKEHILVGTAGHVDHGKSTLVGCLISGKPDNGDGATRIYLDVLKHEIERGLSAELSFAILGFKDGKPIRMKNPASKTEKALVVENSTKLVSFVDTVGHEPWLRTTIRGLLGQKIDYGLLVVAANDGIMRMTKEHLGILIAMEIPVIVALTKIDMVDSEKLKKVVEDVSKLLKSVGRVPVIVNNLEDAKRAAKLVSNNDLVVPIILTSAITLKGYDHLETLLLHLPKKYSAGSDFLMYIDKVYRVSGVGTVVSGCVKAGEVREGDEVYLGPFRDGSFVKTRVTSIEMHHFRIEKAKIGDIVGIALKNVRYDELRRGMALTKKLYKSTTEFEADVIVFTHPTLIKPGYEPVVHLETISETVVFESVDRGYLKAGDRGKVRMRFKYRPNLIFEGQKFIFREGRSKGMGEVVRLLS